MKIKKIIKIICITIILILGNSVLFKDNIKKVAASEMGKDEVREDSLLITCKDQEKMLKLEQLIRSNYKSQLTNIDKIEEANLLKVTLKNKASSRELLADLNGAYKDVVQESGYERKIKIDDTANELKELPKKATLRSMVTKTNDLSKDKNAFHSFQWDINIVTNDGKSYELQKGNHNVKVAIIDSGIDFNHPDLKENIISKGKSFVPNVDDTQDYLGHGTMVAGMIAANGKFMGVGPELGIVPYKVFQNGEAESSWIINAIIQAAKDNMDVINLSLSTYLSKNLTEDKVLMRAYQNALRYAKHHGSVVVASAGNDALNLNKPKEIAEKRGYPEDYQLHFPGGSKEVITVSATSKEHTLASYSNYGGITFSAPGGDYGPFFNDTKEYDISSWILVTYPTNLPPTPLSVNLGFPRGYELEVGSSLATPKVSALTALIIAEYRKNNHKDPSLSVIKNYLKKGAVDRGKRGFDNEFGYGEINAVNSLNYVK